MPEDRRKAHELFQAWEEQCASECAEAPAGGDDRTETCQSAALAPPDLDEAGDAHCSVHQDAELRSQVVQ